MSKSDAQWNVLCGNKRMELKGNRLHCLELHSKRMSKPPGRLCPHRRKQVPWLCLVDGIGYLSGLSKHLSVLNNRVQTAKLLQRERKLSDRSVLPLIHSVSVFEWLPNFLGFFKVTNLYHSLTVSILSIVSFSKKYTSMSWFFKK